MTQDIKTIQELIEADELALALPRLHTLAERVGSDDLVAAVIVTQARWASLQKKPRAGLISSADYNLEQNRIIQNVIELLADLQKRAGEITYAIPSATLKEPVSCLLLHGAQNQAEAQKLATWLQSLARSGWFQEVSVVPFDQGKSSEISFPSQPSAPYVALWLLTQASLGHLEKAWLSGLSTDPLANVLICWDVAPNQLPPEINASSSHQLPRNGKPISAWQTQDSALTEVIRGMKKLLTDLPQISPHGDPSEKKNR